MTKYKPVAVEVKIALTRQDVAMLMQNSLERVINNVIDCGILLENKGSEEGSSLWQDCEELKPLLTKIWGLIQNEIWKKDFCE